MCVSRSRWHVYGGSPATVAAAARAARAALVQQPNCWPADRITCTAGPRAVAAACRAPFTAGGTARASSGARWCRSAVTGDEPKVLSRVDRSPERPPCHPFGTAPIISPTLPDHRLTDEDFRSFFFFFARVPYSFSHLNSITNIHIVNADKQTSIACYIIT